MRFGSARDSNAKEIERRYRNSFGRAAGYLPKDRAAIGSWHAEFTREVESKRAKKALHRTDGVTQLEQLLDQDGIVRMYVTQMIDQVGSAHQNVQDIPDLLDHLDHIVTYAPRYGPPGTERNFFPLSALFVYMMMTPAGEAVFRNTAFNDALRAVLKDWCTYLDSGDSLSVVNKEDGWLSPAAVDELTLDDFVIPDPADAHGGFLSFNDFFHREVKSSARPIDGTTDAKCIVSANDGRVVKYASQVQRSDTFWLKGQPYSLFNMLNGDEDHTRLFTGGTVFQSFLSGGNYHRWRAPVDGIVRKVERVEALMFSDAETAGVDPDAGTQSQGYETAVNTRGLIYIESAAPIGTVCVMPIGITEISSITIDVHENDVVKKGDELGWFSYGGSSMCLVFQPGAVDHFTVPQNTTGDMEKGAPIKVNAQIAQSS
ncbi:phophatidylserine decarboxylase associated domain-containing protein [Streptomyces sp. NPDC059063]|uniref:phophatidylserine decarboxylase associated domain-containing protein n=1 Tax=unclassified Streptomyces TaxID=2593676 RepID=UPI003680E1BD